ncbi:MAG: hypothetical protein IT376_19905 [Polyangiaceae bacterium]|nr:hypothetical protein [Polyangiaceae bacterium]
MLAALPAVPGLLGCGEVRPRVLRARAHVVAGCDPGDGRLDLSALGDFGASATGAETLALRADGTSLPFRADTAALEARLDAPSGGFWSLGARDADDVFDLPLLPRGRDCPIAEAPPERPGYPFATGGEALGASASARVALVAGSALDAADSARALAIDLDTLEARELADGLPYAVAGATITPLGARDLLIAGGVSPLGAAGLAAAPPLDRAIVFDGRDDTIDRAGVILLSRRRADHAAVPLASGDVALVGGRDERGEPLADLEVVSAADRTVRVLGVARLRSARRRPRAAVLDDGRVLVVGGVDAAGAPVDGAEWLTADVARTERTVESLRLAAEHAMVALPLGGALVVGACVSGAHDCGALPSAAGVVRVDPTGALTPLPPLPWEGSQAPQLIAAPDGAPWLWVRDAAAGEPRLLRFDPWSGEFVPAEPERLVAPALSPAPIAVDGGLALWLAPAGTAARGSLRAWRHDVRGELSRDTAPLGLASPEHLVPDRHPGSEVAWRPASGLELAGPARVGVAEVRVRDVRLDLEVTGAAPRVGFGGAEVGGESCAWPEGDGAVAIVRRGARVELFRDGATRSCAVPAGRVRLALASAPGGRRTTVRSIRVTRLP